MHVVTIGHRIERFEIKWLSVFVVGDGMVHAVRFGDSEVSYSRRWVRTNGWEVEHAAGEGPTHAHFVLYSMSRYKGIQNLFPTSFPIFSIMTIHVITSTLKTIVRHTMNYGSVHGTGGWGLGI